MRQLFSRKQKSKNFLRIAVVTALFLPQAAAGGVKENPKVREYHFFTARSDSAILRAEKKAETTLQTNPGDPAANLELCKILIATGDYDRADDYGEKAVKLEPKNSTCHLWLARAYGMRAEHSNFLKAFFLVKKAKGQFERAAALDSANLAAQFDLFQYYVFAPGIVGGSTKKALAQRRVIARNPNAGAYRFLTDAILHQDKEELDSAEYYYRRAIAADSTQRTPLLLTIAFMYIADKQFDRGMAALLEYDTTAHNPAAYTDLLAPGFYRNGFLEKTRKEFEDHRKEWKIPELAFPILARMYEREGNRAKAKEYYETAPLKHGER